MHPLALVLASPPMQGMESHMFAVSLCVQVGSLAQSCLGSPKTALRAAEGCGPMRDQVKKEELLWAPLSSSPWKTEGFLPLPAVGSQLLQVPSGPGRPGNDSSLLRSHQGEWQGGGAAFTHQQGSRLPCPRPCCVD